MTITIRTGNSVYKCGLEPGQTLLDAINSAGMGGFDAPCGGKGTCGKCRVRVISDLPDPDDVEEKFLDNGEIESGIRLACRIIPVGDMEIEISAAGKKALIQSAFDGDLSPEILEDESVFRRFYAELPPPVIEDQRSDRRRLFDSLAAAGAGEPADIPLRLLRELPGLLRGNEFSLTASMFRNSCLSVSAGDRAAEYYAVGVDIGTTTVVAYLVRLAGSGRGEVVDHVSGLNSQKGYGGDVISRIEYCMQEPSNLAVLNERITSQVGSLVRELAKRNSIQLEDIGLVTIAGNTTMTHIFAGLNPEGIASAPFIPVDNGPVFGPADDFGLDLHRGCACAVLPGIASYVGADITAGIIATGMYQADELCLLIDIGTNGEIVLGNKDGMTACSTAAGPALEGANISCGMGGIPGAINSLSAEEQGEREVFSYSVIDDAEPAGICGSGIVDAVALFKKAGLIDETGRILPADELENSGVHKGWINCIESGESGVGIRIAEGISITQKDIREIQMAKAAIAAGVKTLLAEKGKTAADVGKLFIAGGFGAAMNKSSAAAIGLFPAELEDAVVISGNTAGKGAVLAALSKKAMEDMETAAAAVDYIELSTSALFQQEYMMAMYF